MLGVGIVAAGAELFAVNLLAELAAAAAVCMVGICKAFELLTLLSPSIEFAPE